MTSGGVVLVDPAGDAVPGLVAGGEVVIAEQFELQGGVERLGDRVKREDPVRPIDWVTCAPRQAAAKCSPVYSPPWSVCMITPATVPPRTAIATHSAARARAVSWWESIANPTQRREDPDGNGWTLREVTTRLPGREPRRCSQE
jgi:hypothetical protein